MQIKIRSERPGLNEGDLPLTRWGQWLLGPFAVAVACAWFAVAAALYAHLVPLGQSPDELAHLAYLRGLSQHLSLPVHTAERQQPPLYYALGAVMYRIDPNPMAIRALSVALGVATIMLTALAARELWPRHPLRWLVACAFLAALPQFQFLSGSITDDAIATTAAALLTWLVVKVCTTHRPNDRLLAAMGASVGAALLAKETDYFLAVILVAVSIAVWRGSMLQRGTLWLAGLPLVIAGWWFGRNLAVYHHPLPGLRPLFPHTRLRHVSQLHQWLDRTFQSFFGLFGNMSTEIQMNGHSIAIYRSLEIASVAALLLAWLALNQRWSTWSARQRTLAATLAAIPILAGLQMLANSVLIDYQAQGRYLMVAAPTLGLMLAFALGYLGRWIPQPLQIAGAVLLIAGALVLDLAGITTVAFHLKLTGSIDQAYSAGLFLLGRLAESQSHISFVS